MIDIVVCLTAFVRTKPDSIKNIATAKLPSEINFKRYVLYCGVVLAQNP